MVSLGSILLIDGTLPSRESTAASLRQDGYECDRALDREQALCLLSSRSYDLVIADLPPSGRWVLEVLERAEQMEPGLPAVIIAESPCLETAIQAVELPVVAYVPTRVAYGDLRQIVQSAMAKTEWFRGVRRIRDRLRQCASELDDLSTIRTAPPQQGGPQESVRIPVTTLQGVASCLAELVGMVSRQRPERQVSHLCKLLQCPVWRVHQNSIYKAVMLLNETKRRFKSKELGQVRDMLEQLLHTLG